MRKITILFSCLSLIASISTYGADWNVRMASSACKKAYDEWPAYCRSPESTESDVSACEADKRKLLPKIVAACKSKGDEKIFSPHYFSNSELAAIRNLR